MATTTISVYGDDYDVEKDFSWKDLILIEELSGVPLGNPSAFSSMAVLGACVFVVMRRTDPDLTWEKFVEQPMDITDEREPEPAPATKPAANKRPPKPAA